MTTLVAQTPACVKYALEMNSPVLIKREDESFVKETLYGYDIDAEDYCAHRRLTLNKINDPEGLIHSQLESPLG